MYSIKIFIFDGFFNDHANVYIFLDHSLCIVFKFEIDESLYFSLYDGIPIPLKFLRQLLYSRMCLFYFKWTDFIDKTYEFGSKIADITMAFVTRINFQQ